MPDFSVLLGGSGSSNGVVVARLKVPDALARELSATGGSGIELEWTEEAEGGGVTVLATAPMQVVNGLKGSFEDP